MKKSTIVLVLAFALVLGSVSSAFAASTENYTLVAPRLQGDIYSSAKRVNAFADFGVKQKWSGNYPIRFAVCNTSRQQVGPSLTVLPGGAAAPLIDLWYNSTASPQSIVVRMDSALLNTVRILCQGTWVWNY